MNGALAPCSHSKDRCEAVHSHTQTQCLPVHQPCLLLQKAFHHFQCLHQPPAKTGYISEPFFISQKYGGWETTTSQEQGTLLLQSTVFASVKQAI